MLRQSPVLLAFLLVAACASHPAAQPAAASSGASEPGAAQDPKSKADAGWPDSQREPFMSGCMEKMNAPDYCACSWEQFRDVFKEGDAQGPAQSDPRLKVFGERNKSACASKLPEDAVKANFLNSCIEDDKRKTSYCECAWPALRKSLAVADFTTDFQGPRYDAAKKTMVTACKGKYPTELAKADFLKGCTKDDAGRAKVCDCAWKKLHAKFSTEEIVAGIIDPDAAGVSACK